MSTSVEAVRSASDQEWREIRLSVWHLANGIRWAVHLRRSRGAALVWQRGLCVGGLDDDRVAGVDTEADILRTVAAALVEIADNLDG